MSYIRFSRHSDLYIYDHVDGFTECCCCRLTPCDVPTIFVGHTMHGDTTWAPDDWATFIAHVEAHIAAGHKVPKYLLRDVRKEAREYGRRAAQSKQGTP